MIMNIKKKLMALLLLSLSAIFILYSCRPELSKEELLNSPDSKTARKSYDLTETQNFFFLPPIGRSATYSGVFDAKLFPIVEICDLSNCTPPYHASFTSNGTGSEGIRVNIVDEHYIVNWNTNKTGAKVGSTYRITVKLNNKTLGYADVIIVKNKSEAKKDVNTIVIVAGQTLPIKFRIEKQQEESDLVVMTNAADPLLLIAKAQNNKTIEVYGLRDELGTPIQLTDVLIKGQTESEITHYKYDNQNRLSKIITSNNTQFLFNWIAEQKAAVTVLANNGNTQLNTVIDFSAQMSATLSNNMQVQKKTGTKRSKLPLKLEYSSVSSKSTSSSNTIAALADPSSSVTINVNRCGVPADADVMLSVRLVDGESLATLPTNKVGTGLYTTTIPTNLAPTINPSKICNQLENVLGYGCTALPFLCPAIEAVLLATGAGASVAVPVGIACAEATAGFAIYCETLGGDGTPGGGDSVLKKLCDAPGLNRTFTQDIILRPYALGLPTNIFGDSQRVPGSGPFPALNIVLGATPKIESLQLTPSAPAAGQNYVANVDVFCVTQGSQVTLTVVGSDGYTDSATYSITSTQSQGRFSLTVPGADTGVQDVVTVKITLADGTILTRTASLVFN
jgi:hypothetical protein